MKTFFSTLFACFILTSAVAQNNTDHVPGQLIIMLNLGSTIEQVIEKNSFLGETQSFLKLKTVLSKSMGIYLVEFNLLLDETKFLRKLQSSAAIAIAQYNHYTKPRVTVPNDTHYASMWGLDNTGQSGGVVDADIDAPEAWDITTGGLTALGDTIVVAVIDGGAQLTHADLNFWKNYNEIAGNGIDDDGNGYIDDVNGWNANNNNNVIGSDAHGTHVCGTIGAKGNNTIGTVGINWGMKVMIVDGSTSQESEAVIAYSYVRDTRRLYNTTNGAKGAFIVSTNSSFGVDNGQPANYPIWCAMYDSLGAVGILSAGATANQNWNIDVTGDIPTSCSSPHLVSVTNTTRMDVKYTSAGYGATTIDIGAPGTSIYSTVPTNNYSQSYTGTSMATPHVAGTIALMYAAACPQFITDYKANPGTLSLMVFNYMMNGVDVLSSMNGLCVSNGRLNAYNSLLNIQSYAACSNSIEAVLPDALNKNEIKNVYPNPSNNWVELEYTSTHDNFNVVVLTVLGQQLKNIKRTNHMGLNKHKLDLSDLSAGVYYIGLDAEGSKSNFVKVVVSK